MNALTTIQIIDGVMEQKKQDNLCDHRIDKSDIKKVNMHQSLKSTVLLFPLKARSPNPHRVLLLQHPNPEAPSL